MKRRLVFYRQVRTPYPTPDFGDLEFRFYRKAWSFARDMGRARNAFPLLSRAKMLLKLLTPSRFFYAAYDGNLLVSYGWIMRGRCRVYDIEPDSSVIGTIYTDDHYRGRGIALACIKAAVNEMMAIGCTRFYIDALETNAPSLRVIQKAGFGEPVRTLHEK